MALPKIGFHVRPDEALKEYTVHGSGVFVGKRVVCLAPTTEQAEAIALALNYYYKKGS